MSETTQEKPRSGCIYTLHVYESGRVSTCYFDTACGQKYVGIPFGGNCKKCDRLAVTK